MLTPERIEEIAEEFIQNNNIETSIPYGEVLRFAHKLLAEAAMDFITEEAQDMGLYEVKNERKLLEVLNEL